MIKIKVPREIKIAIHPAKILFRRNILADENLIGHSHRRRQEISIDPIMPPSERNVTLLHEVGHNIDRVYHLNIDDDTIDRIAQGYGEFFFNNLGIELDWSLIEEGGE